MTGEITLRGDVLPIGGLKEKILAARRLGITTVLCPKLNEKELEEVPADVKRGIEFHLVGDVSEVLKWALVPPLVMRADPQAPPRRLPKTLPRSRPVNA